MSRRNLTEGVHYIFEISREKFPVKVGGIYFMDGEADLPVLFEKRLEIK